MAAQQAGVGGDASVMSTLEDTGLDLTIDALQTAIETLNATYDLSRCFAEKGRYKLRSAARWLTWLQEELKMKKARMA